MTRRAFPSLALAAATVLAMGLWPLPSAQAATLTSTVPAGLVASSAPRGYVAPNGDQLLDVHLSTTQVAVSGFNHVDVVIRVHLTSPTGIPVTYPTSDGVAETGSATPAASFVRAAGPGAIDETPWLPSVPMDLVSGTPQDGWWSRTEHVTAAYNGTFTVTRVVAGGIDVDPRTVGIDASVQVTGTHLPVLTVRQSPVPVLTGSTLRLTFAVRFSDTGQLARNSAARVFFGFDSVCLVEPGGSIIPSSGTWTVTLPHFRDGSYVSCALLFVAVPGNVRGSVDKAYFGSSCVCVRYRNRIAARPAVSSVLLGDTVPVYGSTGYDQFNLPVQLQRLVGRTWRIVGTAPIRVSGRSNLTAQPPARGTFYYRVQCPAYPGHRYEAHTPPFAISAR